MNLEMKVARCSACFVWLFPLLVWQFRTSVSGPTDVTLCCSSDLGLTKSAEPQVSARSELEHLQMQTGLAISVFNSRGVGVDLFKKRSFAFRTLLFDGNRTTGAVSRDGTEIAISQLGTKPSSVVVVHPDGSDFREYAGILANSQLCWSYDNSKLILGTPGPKIVLLDLKSKLVQELSTETPSNEELITSQCWSPSSKQFAYESSDGNVMVYDFGNRNSAKLAKGTGPTWSPDGNWIAYRDGEVYYAIHPSGEGKRILFHKTRAVSGLYWSPDCRFVAYVHQDAAALDTEFYHLMARRLEDGSEAWVANGEDAGAGYNYQWVTNPQLITYIESGVTPR
jgi:Tol biopolymer transport system component